MSEQQRLDYWKRRARDAERMLESEKRHAEATREWALRAFDEQRRLGERITFVYGVARSLGASLDDLKQPEATS